MRLMLAAVYVFLGALLFAIPNISRRELLFAVPVPPDFRQTPAGRHAIRMFRVVIAAVVIAAVGALLISSGEFLSAIAAYAPFAILAAAGVSFYWQNRKLAPAAVQFVRPREAELTSAPEQLPRFAWWLAGPFVILGVAATWLYFNWDRIPARFAVHFDLSGRPDRWAERTARGVYGPLLFGAEICAWFVIAALAGWFGSRRSRSRVVMFGSLIAIQYFLALQFDLIAVRAPLGIPVWTIALLPIVIVIPLIIVIARKMSEPQDPVDSTPNECWKAGIFYYNPNDPVLVVEKRAGLGWTFNFANRWSWILMLGLALVVVSAPFVLS